MVTPRSDFSIPPRLIKCMHDSCNTYMDTLLYIMELRDLWMAHSTGRDYSLPTTTVKRSRYIKARRLELVMRPDMEHRVVYRFGNLFKALQLHLKRIAQTALKQDACLDELIKEITTIKHTQPKGWKRNDVRFFPGHRSKLPPRLSPLRSYWRAYYDSKAIVKRELLPVASLQTGKYSIERWVLRCGASEDLQQLLESASLTASKFVKEIKRLERKQRSVMPDAPWSRMYLHVKKHDSLWFAHWHLYALTTSKLDRTALQDIWTRMGGGLFEGKRTHELDNLPRTKSNDDDALEEVGKRLTNILTYGASWQKDHDDPENFLELGAALYNKSMTRSIKGKMPRS